MRTYSHLLLTAALRPHMRQDETLALLAGSAAPDVPLALLTLGYVLDRRFLRPHLPDKTRCSPTYNQLYFNNAWWIAAHNSLHAPLPLLLLALVGFLGRGHAWGRRLVWFAIGCAGHTAIDIVSHADDGPVLLFPLDWHKRYHAPISYWDEARGGRLFTLLEHLLDILLVVYLLGERRRRPRINTD